MVDIGKNLKIQMKIKRLSSYELAQKAGISKYQVESIMYNRSTRPEILSHLAKTLDIPLEQLTSSEPQELMIENDKEDIDLEMFAEIFVLINKISKNNSMKITSKTLLFKIADKFYSYLKANKENNPNKEEILKGMFIILPND